MTNGALGLTLSSLPAYNNTDGFTIPASPVTVSMNFTGSISSPTIFYRNRMLSNITIDFHITPSSSFEVYVMVGQYSLGETAWQPYTIINTVSGVSRYSVDMNHFIDMPAVLTMFAASAYSTGKVTLTLNYVDDYTSIDRVACRILTALEFDNTYYGDTSTQDIPDAFYTSMKLISVGTRTGQPEMFVKNQNNGILLKLKAPLVSTISIYELNTYLTQITLANLVESIYPPSPPSPGTPRPYPQKYTGVLFYKV